MSLQIVFPSNVAPETIALLEGLPAGDNVEVVDGALVLTSGGVVLGGIAAGGWCSFLVKD